MKIFGYLFNKYGIPILFTGSIGTGIKLYLVRGNFFVPSSTLNSSDDLSHLRKKIIQVIPEPKIEEKSYFDALKESGYTLVTESTQDSVLQNILVQRLFPYKHAELTYKNNRMFSGSPEITFTKLEYTDKSQKKVEYLNKPTIEDTKKWKEACKTALAVKKPKSDLDSKNNTNSVYQELSRLREWCTEPKIKDVLGRHKFQLFTDNRYSEKVESAIKQIILDWFKKEGEIKFWEKQNFFTKEEIEKILKGKENEGISKDSEITEEQINLIKDKCSTVLNKDFVRNSFYLTKDFLDGMDNATSKDIKVDEFQEAALFCSIPTTAKDYVQNAMQGQVKSSFAEEDKQDYCYVDNKKAQEYESIKTTDPFDGKTFWCAVRLLYEPKPKATK
ncbi:hypothetical protein MHSWG343_10050 [Candidatus Mycoplasma haematohominis]|uniref:Uncharacterized protein n=1 Tax=Candidatus Mycoplasma haematohominis TaxID=1494318 RepID=A0A478FS17_9MOLU|nr:hypothetical protein MHSWG343_10050 [Candidatus Mycoplasma haemohominis]